MIALITLQEGTLFFIFGLLISALVLYVYATIRDRSMAWRISRHSLFSCQQCGLVISVRPLQPQPRHCPRCSGRPIPYRSVPIASRQPR